MRATATILVLCCVIAAVLCRTHAHDEIITRQEAAGLILDASAPTQYFDQYVDHYVDRSARATFKQRFWVNDTMYQSGGPIFMICGGEGPASAKTVAGYFWVNQLAERYHGAVVSVEHRFYGESQPFTRITTDKLALLSSAQALEDFAVFASEFPRKFTKFAGSEWVSVGGSYSGNLSAWLRMKYPHIFKAALSESAPVLALDNFTQYFMTTQATLGPTCSAVVKSIFDEAAKCYSTKGQSCTLPENLSPKMGWAQMSALDYSSFMSAMTGVVANTVQYDKDHAGALTVVDMCAQLEAAAAKGTTQLHTLFAELNEFMGPVDASYADDVAELKTHTPGDAGQSWTWQTCNDAFGYFQPSSALSSQLLPSGSITLTYYHQLCKDAFGIDVTNLAARIAETNIHYGARNIISSNIAFLTNSEDPWHNLGVLEPLKYCQNCVVHQTQGHAHCASMYAPRSSDDAAIKETRALQLKMLDVLFAH
ncbi:Peptidase S28 [Carpediemonas membranifera]|uniref:Peptidase S28 n=1 Tax=Carpediemonas membranifera TaxID=201153 RepID=A0A8J6B388_9EUKA|nr:Peptidase S28 [Carpediemonas membranifera]|eukprot:KAG9394773.1 Peptidase S28 [Carpediemonas membranifera]